MDDKFFTTPNTKDMRTIANRLLPPNNESCQYCDLSVGYICDLCEAARQLFLAARTIDSLRDELKS